MVDSSMGNTWIILYLPLPARRVKGQSTEPRLYYPSRSTLLVLLSNKLWDKSTTGWNKVQEILLGKGEPFGVFISLQGCTKEEKQ